MVFSAFMSCFSLKLINLYFLICGLWAVSCNSYYYLPLPLTGVPDTSLRASLFTHDSAMGEREPACVCTGSLGGCVVGNNCPNR